MKAVYKSKIGLAILIPLATLLFTVETLMIINKIWAGGVITGLVILLVAYLYIDTSYIFTSDNKLKIKSGFLLKKQIDIGNIKRIRPTRNPIASPALSLDRLEIFYNQYDTIIVSPKNKESFINNLKKLNPNINIG